MSEHITSSPLTWPSDWKRESMPIDSRFGKLNKPVTIAKAVEFINSELHMMGVPDFNVIISTNLRLKNDGLPYSKQREPDDRGAAVWWKVDGSRRVLAIDKYLKIADNLWAIGKTIEAMRGIERWGKGEILNRVFSGFEALPDLNKTDWRTVLIYFGDDIQKANQAYKIARSKAHPDNGGTSEQFHKINKAWSDCENELR